MDRTEFEKRLAASSLPSVLLFEGEEAHLKESALAALRKALLPEGLEDLNESRLDNPEADALIAAVETVPFMADRRLVILRDYPALTGRSEADDRVIEYLPNVPSSALLLFYCEQKPDSRKKLYTAVKKLGGIVTFAQLKGYELTSFVTSAFHQLDRSCPAQVAEQLIFTCGNDTANLLTEIAKIAAYHSGDGPVTGEEVALLAVPTLESKVFDMVDAVVSGQRNRAFTLFRREMTQGTSSVFILAMLLRQYRILQHIKIMQWAKRPASEMQSALGVPGFALRRYLDQASRCTNGQVKNAVRLCLDTDYEIKSGRLNADGAVEAVILKLLL